MTQDKPTFKLGITGASGFLGSGIYKYLHDKGETVIVLDDLVHPDLKKKDSYYEGPLDWVIHLGATKNIEASFEDAVAIYRRNLHSTLAALDIALKNKARFLYMSSYVYGQPAYLPIDEKHPTSVLNPYMGSKLIGEQICSQFHQTLGMHIIILRGFTLYGPLQIGNQLIPSIIKSIHTNQPVLLNDPLPRRDYLYITDFLELIEKVITSDFTGYEMFNVGGGKVYQNIEVAKKAIEIAGRSIPIHTQEQPRKNDVSECYANIEKISNKFNWHPKVDLFSGLKKCLSTHLSV